MLERQRERASPRSTVNEFSCTTVSMPCSGIISPCNVLDGVLLVPKLKPFLNIHCPGRRRLQSHFGGSRQQFSSLSTNGSP
ncbi:hypothetical protein DPMN_193086 [Dreissena polymorpha]|uniref:Uncharacterized protein n=1 Tax=Dreissena polymorpha TaxID=45954 RepID=A0A9D3Y689_DREPO|nr:hypothetical protein DPMN_193086 [Dreissena polymorpha]